MGAGTVGPAPGVLTLPGGPSVPPDDPLSAVLGGMTVVSWRLWGPFVTVTSSALGPPKTVVRTMVSRAKESRPLSPKVLLFYP